MQRSYFLKNMLNDEWEKIKKIVESVLNHKTTERNDFLDGLNLSVEMRAEIDSLIAFDDESADFLNQSAVNYSRDFFDDEDINNSLIGQKIGVYSIHRELGFGGMGAVYLAERNDGKFEQKVALKFLKRELNTAALRRRFKQEREILASLEHPNIARLIDAGTTDDKIPYFAMEYVEGLPIDEYCRKNKLNLNQRLDLFRIVCNAVAFAHRNLIVHRDLKPSNVLVSQNGTPKLLDFGISKILSEEFDQTNSATVTKLGVMTPSYASPEQLQSKSVTTATDIYSLGVILYELLSGHRPFEAKESDLKQIYQAVLENEPPLPSAMIETFSKTLKQFTEAKTEVKQEENKNLNTKFNKINRETGQNRLQYTISADANLNSQSLRGDLDNIVLKAIRKEPERRYSSAENFSEDIKKYLRGLPVSARPNTFSYRAEKFVKRNRASVFAGLLIFIAVLGGIVATLWQSQIAQAERLKAEKRFNEVRKLANSNLFDVYPEIENLEGSIKAREKILTNALEYLDSLSKEAAGDLELQSELATAYEKVGDVQGALNNSSLGNIKAGLESYGKATSLRESVFLANDKNSDFKEKLANNYYVTGRTLWNNTQTKEAENAFEKSLKLRRELILDLPDSIDAKNRLAVLLIDYGAIPAFNFEAKKALELFNQAIEIIETLRQKEPENIDLKKSLARGLRILSKAKSAVGDYDGGLNSLNQALQLSKELADQFPTDFKIQRSVWLTESMTCELFIDQGDGIKSAESCLKTINFPEKALSKEPENGVVAYDLAISHFNTSRGFRLAEKPADAIIEATKAIDVMSKLSKKNPDDSEYKRNLAIYETEKSRALIKINQPEKAISGLENAIATLIPIIETDKETTTYQYDLCIAYQYSAAAYSKTGNKKNAIINIDKALTIANNLKTSNLLRTSDGDLISQLEKEKAEYSK